MTMVKLLQPVNAKKQEIDEDFERELAALTVSNPAATPLPSQDLKQVRWPSMLPNFREENS